MCYQLPPCFVSISSFKLLVSCIVFVIVSHSYRAALVMGTERLPIINFAWPVNVLRGRGSSEHEKLFSGFPLVKRLENSGLSHKAYFNITYTFLLLVHMTCCQSAMMRLQ